MTIRYHLGWWRVYGAHPHHVPAFKTEAEALAYMEARK